jgi:hypothetical protein
MMSEATEGNVALGIEGSLNQLLAAAAPAGRIDLRAATATLGPL